MNTGLRYVFSLYCYIVIKNYIYIWTPCVFVTVLRGFVLLRGKRDSFPFILLLKRNNITIGGTLALSCTYVVYLMLHIRFKPKKT